MALFVLNMRGRAKGHYDSGGKALRSSARITGSSPGLFHIELSSHPELIS